MDRDEDLLEAPDLTGKITIVDYAPVFFGPYSHIFKGFYSGEPVAIKVLRYSGLSLPAIKRKVTRERKVWARVKHANVVPLYGYTEESKLFGLFGALISPWHEYGDADQFLQQHGGSLSVEDRRKLWKGVVDGVGYLHTYDPVIIHGDLKPSNVLIDDSGTPRICDFGLSRIFLGEGDGGMTTTTPHTGTDRYLSPELVRTRTVSALSKASDVYALGCIGLYFFFLQIPYAHRPNNFLGEIFQDIRNGVPPAIRQMGMDSEDQVCWDILESCWNLDPNQRLEVSAILEKLNARVEYPSIKDAIMDHPDDGHYASQVSDNRAYPEPTNKVLITSTRSMISTAPLVETSILVPSNDSPNFSSQNTWHYKYFPSLGNGHPAFNKSKATGKAAGKRILPFMPTRRAVSAPLVLSNLQARQ